MDDFAAVIGTSKIVVLDLVVFILQAVGVVVVIVVSVVVVSVVLVGVAIVDFSRILSDDDAGQQKQDHRNSKIHFAIKIVFSSSLLLFRSKFLCPNSSKTST